MIEFLAIPGWQTPPTTLDAWVNALSTAAGLGVVVRRESPQGCWLDLAPIRLRGFAVLAGAHVEAINFELHSPDPAVARQALDEAAAAIGWELHEDDPDDDDDAED